MVHMNGGAQQPAQMRTLAATKHTAAAKDPQGNTAGGEQAELSAGNAAEAVNIAKRDSGGHMGGSACVSNIGLGNRAVAPRREAEEATAPPSGDAGEEPCPIEKAVYGVGPCGSGYGDAEAVASNGKGASAAEAVANFGKGANAAVAVASGERNAGAAAPTSSGSGNAIAAADMGAAANGGTNEGGVESSSSGDGNAAGGQHDRRSKRRQHWRRRGVRRPPAKDRYL